jgi:nitrate/TMAO reductase-like tetraheme cytochrome c subunit
MIFRHRTILLAGMALLLLAFGVVSAQEKVEPMTSPLQLTANDCKSCHPRNYEEWDKSYHSKSVVAMHAGFKKYITTQEQARGRGLNRNELMACMGCHAPAMRFASDEEFARLAHLVKTDQKDALAGLSVDCLACHALYASGHPEVKPPEEMEKQTYYGPLKDAVKTVHGNQYAPEMEKSEFCKGCHTYVTPADMKVESDWDIICSLTYDAWAEGPHGLKAKKADQKQCQSCHMEKKEGKAADVANVVIPTRQVANHSFPGWHDAANLNAATEISLAAKPAAGALQVTVTINNKAGHRIPDT